MRKFMLLAGTALLAACGGAGPETAGSSAPIGTVGVGGGNDTDPATGNPHSFVDPTRTVTYQAIGAAQHLRRTLVNEPTGDTIDIFDPTTYNRVQTGEYYNSNASTARDSKISITYDPRSAEFTFRYDDPLATTSKEVTFQDPLHRTDYGGAREPQYGNDDFSNEGGAATNGQPIDGFRYLEAGDADGGQRYRTALGMTRTRTDGETVTSNQTTLFYQKPGTDTNYVTLAGFLSNDYQISRENVHTDDYDRAVFVFGERTASDDIPATGTGTYTGPMLATMIFNDQKDIDRSATSFLQWIQGRATTTVDFATSSFNLSLQGEVNARQQYLETGGPTTIQPGAIFEATGNGAIDFRAYGGFQGRFTAASFANAGETLVLDQAYLSGSSIDGAFFGPAADEVGGSFRIVSGVPDERVDIMGGFTGRK